MNRIAVLILTYNEEENIADCIASADFADEIVVIDSGSEDRTGAIAAELGATVIVHPMAGFAAQRNFALTQTGAEWVLYLDADERITSAAGAEIRQIVSHGEPCAYEILRLNIVFGQRMKHGGHAPDYSLRLYPRSSIQWEGTVHEKAMVGLPIKKMKHVMHHYTYTDWDKYFVKFNHYTTLMADQMREKGKKASFIDLTLRPAYAFFRFYILKSGWRDGKMGLTLALLHGFYTMAKYIKLYDWQESGAKK